MTIVAQNLVEIREEIEEVKEDVIRLVKELELKIVTLENRLAAKNLHLELISEIAYRPLSNSLEIGFRHSPLTLKEKIERYEQAFVDVNRELDRARNI